MPPGSSLFYDDYHEISKATAHHDPLPIAEQRTHPGKVRGDTILLK